MMDHYNYIMNGSFSMNHTLNETFIDCLHNDYLDPMCDMYYDPKPFALTPGKVLSAIGIAVLIVGALVGNVLVCVAFCHYKRLRTVPNYFIISLAISDIIVAAISMPIWLSFEVTGWENLPYWIDFLKLALFWECLDILACVSSIANLAAISLDRLFSIIAPLRHRTRMTPVVALMMITAAWVFALTISLLKIKQDFTSFPAFVAAVGFFFPLMVIIASYLGIYIKFRIRSSRQGTLDGDWNLEKTLLIVIGLFFVCWSPFFIASLLYYYCFTCPFDDVTLHHLRGFTKWMHYLNSCCNPIVYGFCNINFKTAFWALLGSCFARRYSDMDLAPCSRETSNSQAGTILRHLKSIKRKLSWKREVEESMVSNAGEVNDNSLSLAMLALQLKNGQSIESQEAQALLGTSDSRPSSKASEDVGLTSDERSSIHDSSGDEIAVNRYQERGSDCSSIKEDVSACQTKPREFTNKTYKSALQSSASSNAFDLHIELATSENSLAGNKDYRRPVLLNGDGRVGKNFLSKVVAQLNRNDKRESEINDPEYYESEDSTNDYNEKLIQPESSESSPTEYSYLDMKETKVWQKRPSFVNVSIIDSIANVTIQAEDEKGKEIISEEQIIDTKESIV